MTATWGLALADFDNAGSVQWRQVECRTGDHLVHFGLGKAGHAQRVSIAWPSGQLQRVGMLDARRVHTIREPLK
ncbi:MAG: ASPIC/UnbV domain-containing protein [Geminicoccales bacterium]